MPGGLSCSFSSERLTLCPRRVFQIRHHNYYWKNHLVPIGCLRATPIRKLEWNQKTEAIEKQTKVSSGKLIGALCQPVLHLVISFVESVLHRISTRKHPSVDACRHTHIHRSLLGLLSLTVHVSRRGLLFCICMFSTPP